jgi:general secretion pathway protein K
VLPAPRSPLPALRTINHQPSTINSPALSTLNSQLSTHQSGIALIIVLVVITVLGTLAIGLAFSMRVETKLARNASFDGELEWLGRSGIELARYVLAQSSAGPAGAVDALNQRWAGGPGDTNDPLASIPLDNYPLGHGKISIKITDLDRKFNINNADEVILRQALLLIGVDAGATPTIVDSILDWRDRDEDKHMNGAESDFYQAMNPPYYAKNGPIDDLTELLLINGITPPMYWGSSAAGSRPSVLNRPQGASKSSRSPFEEPTYAVGLADLFTALSGRTLNINTASTTTFQLIPEIDENIANAILTARAGPDGVDGTEDDMPFRSPMELMQRVPGIPPTAQNFTRFFGVKSLVFEVKVHVEIGGVKRVYTALLRRLNPRDPQLLNMYWR